MTNYEDIKNDFQQFVLTNNYQEISTSNFILENDRRIRVKNIIFDENFIDEFIEDLKGRSDSKFICFDNCEFELFYFAEIYKNLFNNKFEFVQCTFDELRFNHIRTFFVDYGFTNYFVGYETQKNTIKLLEINDSIISEELVFDLGIFLNSVDINNSDIQNIKLLNQPNINISIQNSDFLNFKLENSTTDKSTFKTIHFKGITVIKKSIFNEKVVFEDVSFDEYVNFSKCHFQEGLNLDDSIFYKEANFNNIELNKKGTSQETYRILKNSFEKINNKIEANKYHSLELSKNRENLLEEKKFPTWIVSFLHWISSNHSTNWWLPLILIFIVSFLTNIYLGCDITVNNIFKFINLISKVDNFNDSYTVMTLNKIALGYLYYQFLTSVRKDTRK
ncbi:MAG: pentapeptide repeat-containing protein [Sulfurospirillaceae bacterium]|nr:pentapeptide repeat-containing protein [Sulfurospirillaceae bacterium]